MFITTSFALADNSQAETVKYLINKSYSILINFRNCLY